MTDFRITGIARRHGARAITDVRVSNVGSTSQMAWTLGQVMNAMDQGDTFHVFGPKSRRRAEVSITRCHLCGQVSLGPARTAPTTTT